MALLFSLYSRKSPERFRRTMADEAMRRFDRTRPDRVSALAMAAEIDLMQSLLQVRQGRAESLLRASSETACMAADPKPRRCPHRRTGRALSRFQPMAGARRIGAVLSLEPLACR